MGILRAYIWQENFTLVSKPVTCKNNNEWDPEVPDFQCMESKLKYTISNKKVIQLHGPAFYHNLPLWRNTIIIHFISLV